MSFLQAYHDLTHHIVPGPQSFSYFVPLILLPIALLIPRTILSRWQSIAIFMPTICFALAHTWRTDLRGLDVISVDVLLWSIYLLVLRDPWNDMAYLSATKAEVQDRHEGDAFDSKQSRKDDPATIATIEEIKYPGSFLPRLSWVGTLLVSIRLNNWKIGIATHDAAQPPKPGFSSRTTFTLYTILCFCRGYLILDITSAYVQSDAYFTDPSIPITSHLPHPYLALLPPQLFRTMIIGAQAWALIGQMFYLPCLLPVALNAMGLLDDAWSPQNWAPYFGSSSSIFLHGVRGFWGQYWHQMMRHSCSGPGYAIADALNLRSKGLLRYTVITSVAFTLSGFVHMGLVPPEPVHAIVSANVVRLYMGSFFWVQPMGMLLETLVARGLKAIADKRVPEKRGSSWLRMLLNAVWVVCWFSISLPLLGQAGRQLGYWRYWLVPVSVWKWLQGADPIAWPVLQ